MSVQTVTIEVDQQIARLLQALQAKAARRGVTLETLLRPLAEADSAPPANHFYETATTDEWIEAFRDWVASHAHRNYGFVDDSRASIYTREDEAL